MKNVKLLVFGAAALCFLLAVPPAHTQAKKDRKAKNAGGDVEQQITALSDQTVQALLKGDTSFFEKYYADDAMIIRGVGTLFTKAKDIENLKSGALKFEAYDVHEKKIHTYGDTAVVNLEAFAKGLGGGKSFSGDFRVTWVWVKQKGNWKLTLYQVTPVAPASQ